MLQIDSSAQSSFCRIYNVRITNFSYLNWKAGWNFYKLWEMPNKLLNMHAFNRGEPKFQTLWDSLIKWRALNPVLHREKKLCNWVHWTVWPGQWGCLQSGPEQSLQEASCCHGFRFLPNVQFTIAAGLSVSRKGLKMSLWWEGEKGFSKICAGCFPAGDIHNSKWCHIVENAEKFFKQQKTRVLAENQKELGGVKMCVYVHT